MAAMSGWMLNAIMLRGTVPVSKFGRGHLPVDVLEPPVVIFFAGYVAHIPHSSTGGAGCPFDDSVSGVQNRPVGPYLVLPDFKDGFLAE